MAKTIYLKDGSMECIFDEGSTEKVCEDIIRRKLGDDLADLCHELFQTVYTNDTESDMIIDDLTNALRDIQEYVTGLNNALEGKRLSRKDVEYHTRHIQKILDENL